MENTHPFYENAGNCFTAKEKEVPRVWLFQKQQCCTYAGDPDFCQDLGERHMQKQKSMAWGLQFLLPFNSELRAQRAGKALCTRAWVFSVSSVYALLRHHYMCLNLLCIQTLQDEKERNHRVA